MSQLNLSTIGNFKYNETKFGIWGTLGGGAGCDVHFIQLVLTSRDLDNIKLISDIPESKKWSIKELFQRNINYKRVDSGIIPYMEDVEKIKFFNPITLMLLPHNNNNIMKEVPYLKPIGSNKALGADFEEFEFEDHYKIGYNDTILQLGKFEWNKDKCSIVAIDGQHRLSALKKLKNNGSPNVDIWRIPAVLLCIHKTNDNNIKVGLIDAVRRVFIDINDKAEKVSEERKILLNDSIVLDVITQEIIEFSNNRSNINSLPLQLFNWRGDTDNDNFASYISILTIKEVNSVLNEYFGLPHENHGSMPNSDMPNWLSNASISTGSLSYNAVPLLRDFVNKDFVPGFHAFLSNIVTFKNYIEYVLNLTSIEDKYCLEKEAFGNVDNFNASYEKYYINDFKSQIKINKDFFPDLLDLDIGKRAILYIYSQKDKFEKFYKESQNIIDYTWEIHAEKVSELINKLIRHKWFSFKKVGDKLQIKVLTGLVYSSTGDIVYYKIEDVPKAYGALLMRLCLNLLSIPQTDDYYNRIKDECDSLISSCYLKDQKKIIRADLSTTWDKSAKALTKEVNKKSNAEVDKLMSEFEKLLSTYNKFSAKYKN